MSLLPEGASGVVNNSIPLAETLLLLPRRRRQLLAFDFRSRSAIADQNEAHLEKGGSFFNTCSPPRSTRVDLRDLGPVAYHPVRYCSKRGSRPCGFEGYAD